MNSSANFSESKSASGTAFVDSVALVFLPIVSSVGVAGNLLVIWLYVRSRALSGHAGNMMFVSICALDTLTLLFGITWHSLRLYTKYVRRMKRQALLQSTHYVVYMTCLYLLEPWTVAASTWIECLLSVARCVAVYWPHRAKLLFGYRSSRKAVLLVVVVALLARVPIWLVELRPLNLPESLRKDMKLIEPVFTVALCLLLPLLIITVTTACIIRVLKHSRAQFACHCATAVRPLTWPSKQPTALALSGRNNNNNNNNTPWNFNLVRITFVLVGKNVSYFVFLSTYIAIDLIYLAAGPAKRNELLINAYTLSYMLAYVHQCSNFFICLAGGQRFRQQFARLFSFTCAADYLPTPTSNAAAAAAAAPTPAPAARQEHVAIPRDGWSRVADQLH